MQNNCNHFPTCSSVSTLFALIGQFLPVPAYQTAYRAPKLLVSSIAINDVLQWQHKCFTCAFVAAPDTKTSPFFSTALCCAFVSFEVSTNSVAFSTCAPISSFCSVPSYKCVQTQLAYYIFACLAMPFLVQAWSSRVC
jgi:hypothetical protein